LKLPLCLVGGGLADRWSRTNEQVHTSLLGVALVGLVL